MLSDFLPQSKMAVVVIGHHLHNVPLFFSFFCSLITCMGPFCFAAIGVTS